MDLQVGFKLREVVITINKYLQIFSILIAINATLHRKSPMEEEGEREGGRQTDRDKQTETERQNRRENMGDFNCSSRNSKILKPVKRVSCQNREES